MGGEYRLHAAAPVRWPWTTTTALLATLMLGACASTPPAPAPLDAHGLVEDRALRRLPADFPIRELDAYTRLAWADHPDLRVARAACALAEAEVALARRPSPLELDLGVERRNPGGGSGVQPGGGIGLGWLWVSPDRRRLRQERARAAALEICLGVPAAAWTLRQRLHAAWLNLQAEYARRRLLDGRAELLGRMVEHLERWVAAGQDEAFALARLDLALVRVALAESAAVISSARAEFAASLGLSTAALDNLDLALPQLAEPPALAGLPGELIRVTVLTGRAELRALLAGYLVSEAELQLAAGSSWPDLRLSPAVVFDQAQLAWQLATQIVLPLAREREPAIQAALAGRKLAAERFGAAQHRVLAELEQGLRRYAADYLAWTEGSALRRTAAARLQRVLRLREAGEADVIDVLRAELELATVKERLLGLQLRGQRALVDLEAAAQHILVGDPGLSPDEAPAVRDEHAPTD